MSERKFLVRRDIEIDELVIDAVFDFLNQRSEAGDDPSHVVLAMLCVVEMIQHASTGKESLH